MRMCKTRVESVIFDSVKFCLMSALLAISANVLIVAAGLSVDVAGWQFMVGVGLAWLPIHLILLLSNYPHVRKNGAGHTWRVSDDQIIVESKRFVHDAARAVSAFIIYCAVVLMIQPILFAIDFCLSYMIAVISVYVLT